MVAVGLIAHGLAHRKNMLASDCPDETYLQHACDTNPTVEGELIEIKLLGLG